MVRAIFRPRPGVPDEALFAPAAVLRYSPAPSRPRTTVRGVSSPPCAEFNMPEMRHELAIGESIVIDDYLLTVEDIRGAEVVFRIEPIPAGSFPGDDPLSADGGWTPEASVIPADTFSVECPPEVNLDETNPRPGKSSPRARPR